VFCLLFLYLAFYCHVVFSLFLVIPHLLVYLTCNLETIRRSSVQALRAILCVHRSSSSYRLLKKLTKNEDEIASDAGYASMVSYTFHITANVLVDDNNNNNITKIYIQHKLGKSNSKCAAGCRQ